MVWYRGRNQTTFLISILVTEMNWRCGNRQFILILTHQKIDATKNGENKTRD